MGQSLYIQLPAQFQALPTLGQEYLNPDKCPELLFTFRHGNFQSKHGTGTAQDQKL
jgi:hypothetical protein